MGRRPLLKDVSAALKEGYENGYTLSQLAKLYKGSRSTVRERLLEQGVKMRSVGSPGKNRQKEI